MILIFIFIYLQLKKIILKILQGVIMKAIYLFIMLSIISTGILVGAEKKMVLVEKYTSMDCQQCGTFDPVFKSLVNQYSNDVIPIVFHTGTDGAGDVMYKHNEEVVGRYSFIYNVNPVQIPATWIQGTKVDFQQFSSVTSYLGQTTPVNIKIAEERTADKLNVTIGIETDEPLQNYRVYTFVVENNLNYSPGTSGVSNFNWIVRKGLPNDNAGTNIVFGSHWKKGFQFSTDWHPEWNRDNIYVVAFVQAFTGGSYEIIQAAKTGVHTVESVITSSKDVLDFGEVDSKKDLEVFIQNNGLKAINIEDISIENNDKNTYRISFGGGVKTIEPYGEARLIVECFPKENGEHNSELIIKSNSSNDENYRIELRANSSVIVPFGQISSANNLAFGDNSVAKTLELEISNTGTGDLSLFSIDFENNEDGAFSHNLTEINENNPLVIEPNGKSSVEVTFTPRENKFYNSQLIINSDSKLNSELKLVLNGRGANVPTNSNLSLSSGGTSVDLGLKDPGSNNTLRIKNNAEFDIQITEIFFTDKEEGSGDSQAFQLISAPTTWVIQNLETTVAFRFNPTEAKEYNVVLNIITAGDEEDLLIDLKATANISSVFGNELTQNGILSLAVLPNPVNESSVIEFKNNTLDNLELVLLNSNGNLVKTIYDGISNSTERISFNSNNLPSGKYFLVATIGDKKEAFSVIINK